MAERERRIDAPVRGRFCCPRAGSWTPTTCQRAVRRIAHEIIERNHGLDGVVLVGLQTGGVSLAERLAEAIERDRRHARSPVGTLDVAFYRDDIGLRPVLPEAVTDIPCSTSTARSSCWSTTCSSPGRTIRAALDALNDYGRPRAVQLAVMVDRGHRELPIRPDYVGKNLPTRRDEVVDVSRRRRATSGRCVNVKHLLSIADLGADGIDELLQLTDSLRRGQRSARSRRCRRCGARPSCRSSTRTPPAPGSVFETAAKRLSADTMTFSVGVVVGEEGRVAARHGRDDRGHGRRRDRRAPQVGGRAVADRRLDRRVGRSTPATAGTSTRPRRCSTATRSAQQLGGRSTGCTSRSSATSSTARVARCDVLAFTALGAEVTLVAPPTLLPPEPRRLAGRR